ncbi:MAG: CocE/NonD family hydrolase [Melioribacteraceae bacterium]|nr:CocE/NonD family hydrolase [Melioribacteraceae bacterium]MCF8263349.1 CocE/NonD family hydrolase [Melioribacteraceae bacterium]
MKKTTFILLISILASQSLRAQNLQFQKVSLTDTIDLAENMRSLAKDFLLKSEESENTVDGNDLFRIEMLAEKYPASIKTIQSLRKGLTTEQNLPQFIQYETYAKAKIKQLDSGSSFIEAYSSVFLDYLQTCSDEQAYSINLSFTTYDGVAQFTNRFNTNYEKLDAGNISFEQALALLKDYFLYYVYNVTEPIVFEKIKEDENKRYLIDENVLITTKDGAEISAIVVRKKEAVPMSAVLYFTIYADPSNLQDAILAASKGYVGVFATSRGKRSSKSKIEPYTHEHSDVYAVIDWISKQAWSDGKVGMYGGSYGGFTQWASMKEKVHPALKTIVPSVAIAPGIDVPMENNVFLNFSYSWYWYVANNKFLDSKTYFDRDRWSNLQSDWFKSGVQYNKMDSLSGSNNDLFKEWIKHPSYDLYWQSMIPYKDEFTHIDIPILTITGYYDDSQRGAMYYYNEHLKYNPDANHFLLVGPYDHWGAQFRSSPFLRGYQIDSVAGINIQHDLVFDWFDYILKGKEKPDILQDKVNFQIMGANKWINKGSFEEMSNSSLVYFLNESRAGLSHNLVSDKPKNESPLNLSIDFADRSNMNNSDYYPWPIVKDSINLKDGLVFISEPLQKETIINGSFSGELNIISNKKDFDFGVNLYELTPEEKYFHLSYYIGRASYAANREKRALLTPNNLIKLVFDNTRIVSKKMSKGSKIVIVINGNKNSYGQINYGTGEEVSEESIYDANVPLELNIHTSSCFNIPVWNNK